PKGRYAIDEVEIAVDGNRQLGKSEIADRMATAASPRFFLLPQGVVRDYELFDRHVLERDLVRVERIYRAHGFYEAHARAGRVEKTSDGHVKVTIVVDEGPVVRVGEVRLDGITTLTIDDSVAALRALRGEKIEKDSPFDEDNYDRALAAVQHALYDRGFAYAKVKGSVEVDLVHHVANVTYT